MALKRIPVAPTSKIKGLRLVRQRPKTPIHQSSTKIFRIRETFPPPSDHASSSGSFTRPGWNTARFAHMKASWMPARAMATMRLSVA